MIKLIAFSFIIIGCVGSIICLSMALYHSKKITKTLKKWRAEDDKLSNR